jgi:hypothetical protein
MNFIPDPTGNSIPLFRSDHQSDLLSDWLSQQCGPMNTWQRHQPTMAKATCFALYKADMIQVNQVVQHLLGTNAAKLTVF